MHAKVLLLEGVQQLDLRIDGCTGEQAQLATEIDGIEARLLTAQQVLADGEAALAATKAEKAELDANLAKENENIRRSDTRLREIKTQKEYQAVSREITSARKIKGELEEQVRLKAAELTELQGAVTAAEEALANLTEEAASQRSELEAKIASLGEQLLTIRAERAAAEKEIPPALLKRYETLRQRRQGVAVVEARAGSCLGCNMNLPPQLYNTLLRVTDLITCPHCQRVLFIRPESQ